MNIKKEIFTRGERFEDWVPPEGGRYYAPCINYNGKPGYISYPLIGISDGEVIDTIAVDWTLIFPTPELATAEAQKWIDAAKGDND